jgi:taurine dioxygenase
MGHQTIEIEPVTPAIGAEVSGVDLARPLDRTTFEKIKTAWLEHLVLFFRDQVLTLDQQKAFGRMFGELHIHPSAPAPEGHPEILVIHADAESKAVAGQGWHSDVSCEEEPPMASMLYLTELPRAGGDTLFASMNAAWEALSDSMQRFLEGLTAVHESQHIYGQVAAGADVGDIEFPSAEHPVVRTHPETGRKALFVNHSFTRRIRGLTRAESRAVLRLLFEHMRNPEFQCRFRWRPGSVAFWDNRCAQHLALWDYYPEVRHGFRVTVKGDRPS